MTGTTPNKDLMAAARINLTGLWGKSALFILVYFLVVLPVSMIPILGGLASWVFGGPLALGYVTFFLHIAKEEDPQISDLFSGFGKFGTALGAYLLMGIFVLLWMLLLIIPGIIATYAYAMTYFIIAEDDNIGPLDAITKSKQMMIGNKWKLFCLNCRFIGWSILGILSLGIGFFWIWPYMNVSMAKFYQDIKGGDSDTPVEVISETKSKILPPSDGENKPGGRF
ncbi:MAG: DUF975 family protein [Candidatus Omnitrophica bacterium]|nr:DUF975 family protein [Candidatus Omnitrophota bacterium]